MMKPKIILVILCLLGLIWFFWPVSLSDQEQIEASLSNIESGVSGQKLGVVLKEISENYEDETGWTKQAIRGILFREFKRKSDFSLHINPTAFQITAPKAEVTADVAIIGGSVLNPNVEAEYFVVQFSYQKEEDDV